MWIPRDITKRLQQNQGVFIQILFGPRQCGKSSLLAYLGQNKFQEITFDDLQQRQLANHDPALFLSQHPFPLLLDEVQYVPNIFPELKKYVDQIKKQRLLDNKTITTEVIVRLTGSNQILIDKHVKETLVGRASYFYLDTLSVHEILTKFPDYLITSVLFTGGWPELYTNPQLSVVQYLNDYIRQYIEKDIIFSAGITKQHEFHKVIKLLAARTGELLNYSSIAQQSDVKSVTVTDWVSILERTRLVYLLQPYNSNLNKRIVKTPKIYFLDTGLASRLQGWSEQEPLLNSPQAGHLFETLVLAEIVKYINNYGKDWQLFMWRTRAGEEVDFLIRIADNKYIALDAKFAIQAIKPMPIPRSLQQELDIKELIIISAGGEKKTLSNNCIQLPLSQLVHYFENIKDAL